MKPKTRNVALEIVQQNGFSNVTTVRDATAHLTFPVSEKDARLGVPKDHTKCPAARSLTGKETIIDGKKQKVVGAIIAKRSAYVILENNTAVRYRVPEALAREEIAVDRGGKFHAGDFKLTAPGKGERLEDRYTGATHKPSRRARPTFTPHFTEGVRTTLGLRTHIS
jgi:hypothetical protein